MFAPGRNHRPISMNTRSFIENSIMELDPVLDKLYRSFGLSTVFIPLPLGQQAPANDKWRGITLERSRSSAHLNLLWNSDIAVVCGPASFNLCGVRFKDVSALAKFRQLNPELKTLTTQHPDGVWLWLKIIGFVPKTQWLPECFWQSHGFVKVHDRRPHGEEYGVLESVEPELIAFASICWSKETTAWLLPEIVASDYGNSSEPAENGASRPNYAFWARYFSLARGIRYVPTQKSFYHCEPGENDWAYLTEERVQDLCVRWIMQLKKSKDHGRITVLAQPEGLKRILLSLRVVAVGELPPEQDVMVQFLDECVTADADSNATTEELFTAFAAFCASRDLAPMPKAIFWRVIGPLLNERFGVRNCHCLVRDGAWRRGYNGVRAGCDSFRTKRTTRTTVEVTNNRVSSA